MAKVTDKFGIGIDYRIHGAELPGIPLLLLHGSALSQVIWRGFGYLAAFNDRPVITMDMRGHGRSDRPVQPEDYTQESFINDISSVLEATNTSVVDIFGYSAGARLALAFALAYPAKVNRLVLGAGSFAANPGLFDRLFFPNVVNVLREEGMDGFLRRWEECSGPLDRATRQAFLANDPLALAAYIDAYDHEPGLSTQQVATVTAPTRVFVGEFDDERLLEARRLYSVMPNASFSIIANVNHGDALLATDAVLDVVEPFLKILPTESTPETTRP